MKQKRTQLEIIHDMLSTMQQRGGRIKPTHLLYKSNLSYKMMQGYLTILKERDLVEEEEAKGEKKVYVLTQKGFQFLSEYKRIAEFTDAFGL
jgi:predicted transcriptional regulator